MSAASTSVQRKPRRLRGLLRFLGIVLILLFLLALFAPAILSSSVGRSIALEQVNGYLNGRIEVADWKIGWLSGVDIKGLRVFDEQKRTVFEAARVRVEVSLLSAAMGRFKEVVAVIDDPNFVILEIDRDFQTNLQRLVKPSADAPTAPKAGDDEPWTLPQLSAKLQVNRMRGSVEFVGAAAPIVLEPRDITIDVPDLSKGFDNLVALAARTALAEAAGDLVLTGSTQFGGDDRLPLQTRQTLALRAFDLSTLAPLAQLGGLPAQVTGIINGQIALQADGLQRVALAEAEDARRLVINDFSFASPLWPGERYRSSKVTIQPRFTVVGLAEKTVDLQVDALVETDQARLIVAGKVTIDRGELLDLLLPLPGSAHKFTQLPLRGKLRVEAAISDMPALTRMLPRTLGLAAGVEMTEGAATAVVDLDLQPASAGINATIDIPVVAGTRDGRRIRIEHPLHGAVTGQIVLREGVADASDLRLSFSGGDDAKPYLRLEGHAPSLANIRLRGNLKGRELLEQVRQFLELKDVQPVDIDLDLAVATERDSAGMVQRIPSATLVLSADREGQPLLRALCEANADISSQGVSAALLHVKELAGDLPLMQRLAGPWLPREIVEQWDLASGRLEGAALVRLAGQQVTVHRLDAGIIAPQVRQGGRMVIDAPRVDVGLQGVLSTDPERPSGGGLRLTLRTGAADDRSADIEVSADQAALVSGAALPIKLTSARVAATRLNLPALQQQFGDSVAMLSRQHLRVLAGSGGLSGKADFDGNKLTFTEAPVLRFEQLTADEIDGRTRRRILQSVGGEVSLSGDFALAGDAIAARLPVLNVTLRKGAGAEAMVLASVQAGLRATLGGPGGADVRVSITQARVPELALLRRDAAVFAEALAQPWAAQLRGELTFSGDASLRQRVGSLDVALDKITLRSELLGLTGVKLSASLPVDATAASPLALLQSASGQLDVPDAARLHAAVLALSPPAEPDALPPLEVTSGRASLSFDLRRVENLLQLELKPVRAEALALRRGDAVYRWPRALDLRLVAQTTLDLNNADPLGQLAGVLVRQLEGGLGPAEVRLIREIKLEHLPVLLAGGDDFSADGVLRVSGELAELLPLLEVLQGHQPGEVYPYAGAFDAEPVVVANAGRVSLSGDANVRPLRLLEAGRPVFEEPHAQVAFNLGYRPRTGDLEIHGLVAEFKTTRALRIASRGSIGGLGTTNRFTGVRLDYSSDYEKAWMLVKPLLGREMVASIGEFAISGSAGGSWTLDGALPADRPLHEAVRGLLGRGELNVPSLRWQGGDVSNLYVPLGLKDGILRVERTNPQAPPSGGAVNGGRLNLEGLFVDLTQPDPRLNAPPNLDFIDSVQLTPLLADTLLGTFVNPAFSNPRQARGLLSVKVTRLRGLPLSSLLTQNVRANDGELRALINMREVYIGNDLFNHLKGFLDIQGDSFAFAIRDGQIGFSRGVIGQDITLDFGGRQLTFAGSVRIEDQEFIPMDLHIHRSFLKGLPGDAMKFIPERITVGFAGGMTQPVLQLDRVLPQLIQGAIAQAALEKLTTPRREEPSTRTAQPPPRREPEDAPPPRQPPKPREEPKPREPASPAKPDPAKPATVKPDPAKPQPEKPAPPTSKPALHPGIPRLPTKDDPPERKPEQPATPWPTLSPKN